MAIKKKDRIRAQKRKFRVRAHVKKNNKGLPRVSVFRSLEHIYAQLIDDNAQATLASCSSLELQELKGNKREKAFSVGKELAKRALDIGVKKSVFDRGKFLYHGRVKALVDGLREGGIKI